MMKTARRAELFSRPKRPIRLFPSTAFVIALISASTAEAFAPSSTRTVMNNVLPRRQRMGVTSATVGDGSSTVASGAPFPCRFESDVFGECFRGTTAITDENVSSARRQLDPTTATTGMEGGPTGSLSRRREVLLASCSKAVLLVSASFLLPRVDVACAEGNAIPPTPPLEEPSECRGGAIVSESAVPGAYQQLCMDLPERKILLKATGSEIVVYQGTNTDGSGSSVAGRTGVAVWNSGLLLTRLLDGFCKSATNDGKTSPLRGKTVMELGCGAGLASVAAAKLGASCVVATDSNAEVLRLAQKNIERNDVADVARTVELRWGAMDASEFDSTADIVVGSDLTYNSGSWRALAETMATVLRPGGVVFYLSLGHSGFNSGGEMGGFLSVVESEGLEVIADRNKDSWPQWTELASSLQDLLRSSVSAKERAVIDANGGARVILLGKKPLRRLA